MEGQNFEPYLDWDGLTDEMVEDLRQNVVSYKDAQEAFLANPSKETAAALLKPQFELTNICSGIYNTIWTTPVMVHEAGPKTHEDHEGTDHVFQRCVRCGSILQVWHEGLAAMTPVGPMDLDEDTLPWWDEGDVVAKSTTPNSTTMYEIEKDRPLEKHERCCPDLADALK